MNSNIIWTGEWEQVAGLPNEEPTAAERDYAEAVEYARAAKQGHANAKKKGTDSTQTLLNWWRADARLFEAAQRLRDERYAAIAAAIKAAE